MQHVRIFGEVWAWLLLGAVVLHAAPDALAEVPQTRAEAWQRDLEAGRKHWAFQKPLAPAVPEVADADWPAGDIDRFLLAAMEEAGVKPVADADREALLRRVSFDLVGLPPTPEEIRAFLDDTSSGAFERVVDRLLASPRFGERQARHWLDVARYAESSGKETNLPYPHAWRYRDWVIAAFNDDMPYDDFLKAQLAGDLLKHSGPADQARKIIATGFLAIGPKGLNERDRRQFRMDVVDEQIDVVSQSMLGLTLACARCHDHAFDPVSQRDYHALAGIFMSTDTLYGTGAQLQNAHPSTLIELPSEAGLPSALAPLAAEERARLERLVGDLAEDAQTAIREAAAARAEGREQNGVATFLRVQGARARLSAAQADRDQFREDGSPRSLAMGVLDRPQPVDSPLLERGEVDQPGETVPRGLVEVLCAPGEPTKIAAGSGRLDLAFWIASPDNPLTARVMVNRVWLKLMGEGLVSTPDNFGVMGMAPSNPALLDHLAVTFMEDGWSVKKLVRRIVTSHAYRLAAVHDGANFAVDPDNRLRWRMDQRRLDAEAIRDAMLAVAGRLDLASVAGSPVARIREDRQGMAQLGASLRREPALCRSVYLPIVRDQLPEFLATFDFPDASLVSGRRDATNTPAQGLFLLNHPEVVTLARAFAERVAALPDSPEDRWCRAFEMALGRRPGPGDIAAIEAFRAASPPATGDRPAGGASRELVSYCQALFATAEFRHVH